MASHHDMKKAVSHLMGHHKADGAESDHNRAHMADKRDRGHPAGGGKEPTERKGVGKIAERGDSKY
jgi:hypothetical protein